MADFAVPHNWGTDWSKDRLHDRLFGVAPPIKSLFGVKEAKPDIIKRDSTKTDVTSSKLKRLKAAKRKGIVLENKKVNKRNKYKNVKKDQINNVGVRGGFEKPVKCGMDSADADPAMKRQKRKRGYEGAERNGSKMDEKRPKHRHAKKCTSAKEKLQSNGNKKTMDIDSVTLNHKDAQNHDKVEMHEVKKKRKKKNNPLKNKYRHLVVEKQLHAKVENINDSKTKSDRLSKLGPGLTDNSTSDSVLLDNVHDHNVSLKKCDNKNSQENKSVKDIKGKQIKKKQKSKIESKNKPLSRTKKELVKEKDNKKENTVAVDVDDITSAKDKSIHVDKVLLNKKMKHKEHKMNPEIIEEMKQPHFDQNHNSRQKEAKLKMLGLKAEKLKLLLNESKSYQVNSNKGRRKEKKHEKEKELGDSGNEGKDQSKQGDRASSKQKGTLSLAERMRQKLNAARFRYLNEQMYTSSGQEAFRLMRGDPQAFQVYHTGFQAQVQRWPLNPVDLVIQYIKKRDHGVTVADFGCGEAKIAQSVPNKVHSFDLRAVNKHVTACDMANVPLAAGAVDIGVFCLALMGTNMTDFIVEASRVLKKGGTLLVAEVVSRFEKVGNFVSKMDKIGFSLQNKDESNKMFVWLEFKKKHQAPKDASKLPQLELAPCLYKRR